MQRSCVAPRSFAAQVNPPYFMNLCGKTTQECLSIVITPRRFGKTTACAIFVASLLLTIPHLVIAIFSTGRRASTMMLAKICQIIQASRAHVRALSPLCAGGCAAQRRARLSAANLGAHAHQQGVPGQGKRILACNQETLKIRGNRPGEERVCHSYPSNVR